jgi:hypothetical protein
MDRAEQVPIFSQRHDQGCAGATEIDRGAPLRITIPVEFGVLQIDRMDKALAGAELGHEAALASRDRIVPSELGKRRRHTACANRTELSAVIDDHDAERALAQPHRPFEHRVEHRCEVAGRGINDLQDFRGRGLLVERLIALGGALVELPSEFRVGALQIGYRVVVDF